MSTPESTQSQTENSTFTHADALKELGQERNSTRTSFRDKEKVLETEREGLKHISDAEYNYRKTLIKETTESIKERAAEENGLTEKMALEMVRERILDAQLERMQAEIDAKNNPEDLKGKLKLAFIEKWRKYPKARFAIGLGLVAASGGFAAAGLGAAAIVPAAARAAMTGVGTYMGAKAGQEMVGAKFERRKGIMAKLTGKEGDQSLVTVDQAAEMSSDERIKRMTALLSAGIMQDKGPNDENNPDRASYEALRQAESSDIQAELEEKTESYFGANLLYKKGILSVLDRRVAEQLKSEHERLKDDKRANWRKTVIAGALGFAAFGASALSQLDVVGGGGGGDSAKELHRAVDNDWGSAGETYTQADFILDQVDGDESKLDAVTKHLNNIQEYHDLDPDAQQAVMQELANNRQIMEVVNDEGINYWRIPKTELEQTIFKHQ